jgi:hypothetical protein
MTDQIIAGVREAAEKAAAAEKAHERGTPPPIERFVFQNACNLTTVLAILERLSSAEEHIRLHAGDCMSLETEINDLRLRHDADMKAAEAQRDTLSEQVKSLTEALEAVRSEFKVERHEDGRILSVAHDSGSLRRVIATLDAALASTEAANG